MAGNCDDRSSAVPSGRAGAEPRARFDALDTQSQGTELDFASWLRVMNEMRRLAHHPRATAELRLRFAERWLRTSVNANRVRGGAVENDRMAYLWSLGAAHGEDASAAVLLGHCYRDGRGARRSLRRARRWYRRGASTGSPEAEFWLQYTRGGPPRWILYRGRALERVGLVLLLGYLVAAPWTFHVGAVAAYLAIAFAGQLVVRSILERWSPRAEHDDTSAGTQLVAGLVAKPWQTLAVAGEDGLVLVPLLAAAHVLGSFLWVAPAAGLLFGLLHFPNFSWRGCLAKGLTYGVAAAVVLPWGGLSAMAVGHVVLDGFIVAIAWRNRPRRGS